jgi:tetratricopeptide (TPR) repeat protein
MPTLTSDHCTRHSPGISEEHVDVEFPHEYLIADCLRKYGAAAYLKCQRRRLNAGFYSKKTFCRRAATAYIIVEKPKRALALLNEYHSGADDYEAIVHAARQTDALHPCCCSLNMIVKNEERNIGRALDSVDDIMDEIVICDTGSTDATKEIARTYGATILSEPWFNDFSRARNTALAASAGSWIFWIDGDDALDPRSKKSLTDLIHSSEPHAGAICIDNIRHGVRGAQFMQIRLFPRIKNVAFERRIHEQVAPSLRRLGLPYKQHTSIHIVHFGYEDPALQKKKALRNMPLIIDELIQSPDSMALLLNLGDCHSVLCETKEALLAYQRIVSLPDAQALNIDIFAQALFNIGLLYKSDGDRSSACAWFEKTLQADPSRSEALYLLGIIAEEKGEREKAFDYFLACSRVKAPLRQTATDSRKIRIDAAYRVAKLLFIQGRIEECEALLVSAATLYPSVVEFYSFLGKVYLCENRIMESARSFMTSLRLSPVNNPDASRGMAVVYMLLGDRRRAAEFLAMIDNKEPARRGMNPRRVTETSVLKKECTTALSAV